MWLGWNWSSPDKQSKRKKKKKSEQQQPNNKIIFNWNKTHTHALFLHECSISLTFQWHFWPNTWPHLSIWILLMLRCNRCVPMFCRYRYHFHCRFHFHLSLSTEQDNENEMYSTSDAQLDFDTKNTHSSTSTNTKCIFILFVCLHVYTIVNMGLFCAQTILKLVHTFAVKCISVLVFFCMHVLSFIRCFCVYTIHTPARAGACVFKYSAKDQIDIVLTKNKNHSVYLPSGMQYTLN